MHTNHKCNRITLIQNTLSRKIDKRLRGLGGDTKMNYEPTTFELVELEFTHKVSEAAEYYFNKTDEEEDLVDSKFYYAGDAMNIMADLMIQRFQYAELMIYDNHNDNVYCDGKKATKELYSELARNHESMHVSIGMLNHNTDLLERMIKAYPEQFNIVWSLYVSTFMKVYQIDSIYLKKEFFKYKIDIDYKGE